MTIIELDHVVVRWIAVSEMENNVYLLTHRETGAQVLIDAAADAEAIAELIAAGAGDVAGGGDAALRAIITTHQHWDHIRALPDLARAHPEAATIAGVEDADAITEAVGVEISRRVDHLEGLGLDGIGLQAIALRGHTPGSRAFVLRDTTPAGSAAGETGETATVLFSGDSLFPGGPGKTWSAADFTSLMDDLEERVFSQLPDDTQVLPGHGAATTLGDERPQLGQWRSRGW